MSASRSKRGAGKLDMVDIETRLDQEILSPVFVNNLERFYSKASTADKARCLELITSLQLGKEIRQQINHRPKTAMAAIGREAEEELRWRKKLEPYATTYEREYFPKPDPCSHAVRPESTKLLPGSYDLKGPVVGTTYNVEYSTKKQQSAPPIRSGSASGDRNNRPHPSKGFLVWRFPSKPRKQPEVDPMVEALTDDKINQVHKRLCQSTYQSDYLAIPQGFQVGSAYDLPRDWKADIPYTLDTVKRYSYQTPNQVSELKNPTCRYGSNSKKSNAASGAIPTATSERQMHIKTRTTYDRHYNDNAGAVAKQIRDVGRKLGADALLKHYLKANGEEKDHIGQLLDYYKNGMTPTPSPPVMPRTSRDRVQFKSVSPATTRCSYAYSSPAPIRPIGESPEEILCTPGGMI